MAPDPKGVVRDVEVLVVPGRCVPAQHPKSAAPFSASSELKRESAGVVLRRDVRRLVVILPVEEQQIQTS